ncbi:UDP-glucuronosyl/UDP-glucosyltransferase [Parasponia andersonii]|uniref:Glycosyltransferase n=1 Tax=Parasponia andersonii TaxID=3476 RepID=A0A2P5DNR6_PARAD|nr:UDP-glucuronosyl/UDP-glucosyltransferase [Parasponia andersonii]
MATSFDHSNHHYHGHHIVLLPFLAHGHLRPFLALARQIKHSSKAVTVTIAATALNLQYLRHSTDSSDDILFAELPFSDHQNTENLPVSRILDLCHGSVSLQSPFRKLIQDITAEEGRAPLCIISDVFFGWAIDVAESLGTLNFTFTTCGAYGTMAYISLWLHLPHRETDSDEFALPGFPERCRLRRDQLHRFLRSADGDDPWSRFIRPQISFSLKSHGWLCNTVEEIEPLGLEILRNHVQRPVWSIGASSLKNNTYSGKEVGISSKKCVEWLDEQKPESVVYVSFGSQNTIGSSQMMELAKGLGKSGRPFVWVVRPPLGFDMKGEFRSEWLPDGFEERMSETKQGLIVRNWAPQLEILSHKSTAVFLSHCGWNSILESLSRGVPIVAWPLGAEQVYNSKMLREEMGVSLELAWGFESRVDEEEVKKVVDLAMDGKGKGGEMRKNASLFKELIKDANVRKEGKLKGSSVKALDDFLSYVLEKSKQVLKPN